MSDRTAEPEPPVPLSRRGRSQTPMLQFKDVNLESSYRVYHNQLLGNLDLLWVAFSFFLLPITALGGAAFLGVAPPRSLGQASPLKEWTRLMMYPVLGLTLRYLLPQMFIRHREVIWVAHRLDVLFGTSLPSSYVFQEPAGSLMFAFGFMGSLLNAVGHKVRFHVQLLLSGVMFLISLAFMLHAHKIGIFRFSPQFFVLHTAVSVILPSVIVYFWDKYTRDVFVESLAPAA